MTNLSSQIQDVWLTHKRFPVAYAWTALNLPSPYYSAPPTKSSSLPSLRVNTYLVDEITAVGDASFKAKSDRMFKARMQHAGAVVVSKLRPASGTRTTLIIGDNRTSWPRASVSNPMAAPTSRARSVSQLDAIATGAGKESMV